MIASPQPRQRPLDFPTGGRGEGSAIAAGRSLTGDTGETGETGDPGDGAEDSTVSAERGES